MVSSSAEIAYDKGYRVKGNSIISPKGSKRALKLTCHYPKFTVKFQGKAITVKCHQLTAWQKYGRHCIGPDIVVRHVNDDPSDFRAQNIELGTHEKNVNDRYINSILQNWIEQINKEASEVPF